MPDAQLPRESTGTQTSWRILVCARCGKQLHARNGTGSHLDPPGIYEGDKHQPVVIEVVPAEVTDEKVERLHARLEASEADYRAARRHVERQEAKRDRYRAALQAIASMDLPGAPIATTTSMRATARRALRGGTDA